PGSGRAGPDSTHSPIRDLSVRGRLHDVPPTHGPVRFRRPPDLPMGRETPPDRARGARATPRAEALRLQEREAGPRRHVHGRGGAGILGGPRVQQYGGPAVRGSLLLLIRPTRGKAL